MEFIVTGAAIFLVGSIFGALIMAVGIRLGQDEV